MSPCLPFLQISLMSGLIEVSWLLITEFNLLWHHTSCSVCTTHCRENKSKGKTMSWYYYNTFYLANSQKGTLRWREKCGEKQDFSDTWPGRDTLSSPLYYEAKWGTRFKCLESAKKTVSPKQPPTHSRIIKKDLSVVVASISTFYRSHI